MTKKIAVLESVRGLSAVYVVLTHFLPVHLLPKESHAGLPLRFGQEAVMLFFLLSGFVIYYSSQKHINQRFHEYFCRRALRIYPIYSLSLLIAYLVACESKSLIIPFDYAQFLGNFFMLQDFGAGKPGVWFETFHGNAALWSLSYEWWFYMLFFPMVRFVRPSSQKWIVALLSLCGFLSYIALPNQIGLYLNYFIIWWTGVELAKLYCAGIRPSIALSKAPVLLLLLFTSLHILNVLFYRHILHEPLSFGLHPVLELRHFAFSLAIVLTALLLTSSAWTKVAALIRPFSSVAPISYALYVLHFPIAVAGSYLSFLDCRFLELAGYLGLAFLAAFLAEFPLQKLANRSARIFVKTTAESRAAL